MISVCQVREQVQDLEVGMARSVLKSLPQAVYYCCETASDNHPSCFPKEPSESVLHCSCTMSKEVERISGSVLNQSLKQCSGSKVCLYILMISLSLERQLPSFNRGKRTGSDIGSQLEKLVPISIREDHS